jgi:uncharacterized protein
MGTALITGASSGIGYELAKRFAMNGHNVALVARREDLLNALADELRGRYHVEATVLCKDLSVPGSALEIYDLLRHKGVSIDYLVNNAGFIVYGSFADADGSEEMKMIQVNLVALTQLTKLFLPDMIRRNSGGILNVASTGSFGPAGFCALYCATKAYVLSMSEGIAEDLAGTAVTVTALCPGATATEFAKEPDVKSTFTHSRGVMSAERVARIGYKAFMRGERTVVPGFFNRLMVSSIRFTPRKIVARIGTSMMKKRDTSAP